MSRLDLKIAGRYMKSRRSVRMVSLITFIATAGVTVGVAALILITGVMNGLQNDLREKILGPTPHIRVMNYGFGLRLDDWESILDTVRAHPDVVAAAPFVFTRGLLAAGFDYVEAPYVIGLSPDTGSRSVTDLPRLFVDGNLSFETTIDSVDGAIILGRKIADRLSVFPGDVLRAVSSEGLNYNMALGSFMPRYWVLEVAGHFEAGMYEYDHNYVVLSLDVAQEFAELGNAVSGIEVRVRDLWDAPTVAAELEEMLENRYRAQDWQSLNANLFSALELEKLGMGIIVLLIVVVAAFNIVSTLTMVVRDKTREIGILRAMGLPRKVIRRTFILQGLSIGLVGTSVGVAIGLFVAWLVDSKELIQIDPSVYFIDHMPIHVVPLDLVVIIFASILVATVATIYPALRASRLHPVEAIRYE